MQDHARLLFLGQGVTAALGVELAGVAQVAERAVMHIGRGLGDVAQRRHFETAAPGGVVKHAFGTGIEGLAGGFRYADHGDLLVGEQRRRVAFGAASDERAKHVHAFQFIGIQGLGIAVGIVVVATVQRDQ